MTETTLPADRYTGLLAAAVARAESIPAHDECFDIAETIGGLLAKFGDYVETVREPDQAERALLELGVAVAEAIGIAVHSPEHACGECGTTEAQTYVVTTLDPEDPNTRTEVCRSCDDNLRAPEGLPALVYDAEATDSYLDHMASMRNWSVTVTTTDGTTIEGTLDGAGHDLTGMATIYVVEDDGETHHALSTEDFRQVHIH